MRMAKLKQLSPGAWLAAALAVAIVACSIYAHLALLVEDPVSYRYFPPFKPYVNDLDTRHLAEVTEYAHIASALRKGEGFAHPFARPTGPTAWMPPVLPLLLAALQMLANDNRVFTILVVVILQDLTLIVTALLVLAAARQVAGPRGPLVATVVFLAALLLDFRLCFQFTHDSWLVLLALDLLIVGFSWWRPLDSWKRACGWGLCGGVSALINPILAPVWGIGCLAITLRDRSWARFSLALGCGLLTLVPWTIRNYLVFGRLIPIKSNLAHELYQSQCLQPDGLIQRSTFREYVGRASSAEARQYDALGEMAFLDRKGAQFRQAVAADPMDFINRVSDRFLGTTLWYVPFDRAQTQQHPWLLGLHRLAYALPFAALLILLASASWRRLHTIEWVVIGVYGAYLIPYIGISYYERYAFPLLAVKVLLVTCSLERLGKFSDRPYTMTRAAPAAVLSHEAKRSCR
jgi:hypothetical protein